MIGIFGGTFAPVHLGHLLLARAAADHLGLQRVIFVPLGLPPHRDLPKASPQSRVNMLQAALTDSPDFEVSTVEIDRPSPSWTVHTLEHFCDEMPDETFCLLMGSDAFRSINQWYQWQSLLDYCHLVVVSRAGDKTELGSEVAAYLARHRCTSLYDITDGCTGGIYWLEADIPDISSTLIRHRVDADEPLTGLLPPAVESLIKEHGHYGY